MSLTRRVAEPLPFVGALVLGTGLLVHPPRSPEREILPATPERPQSGASPIDAQRRREPAVRAEKKTHPPDLLAGWWKEETWPDGSTGRWTNERASLRLDRREGGNDLLVDVSFSHPTNLSTGFIEVNGQRLVRIRNANGRRRMVVDVGYIPDRVLVVRFVAERPFVEHGVPAGGARRLGFFVHEVRLLAPPD